MRITAPSFGCADASQGPWPPGRRLATLSGSVLAGFRRDPRRGRPEHGGHCDGLLARGEGHDAGEHPQPEGQAALAAPHHGHRGRQVRQGHRQLRVALRRGGRGAPLELPTSRAASREPRMARLGGRLSADLPRGDRGWPEDLRSRLSRSRSRRERGCRRTGAGRRRQQELRPGEGRCAACRCASALARRSPSPDHRARVRARCWR